MNCSCPRLPQMILLKLLHLLTRCNMADAPPMSWLQTSAALQASSGMMALAIACASCTSGAAFAARFSSSFSPSALGMPFRRTSITRRRRRRRHGHRRSAPRPHLHRHHRRLPRRRALTRLRSRQNRHHCQNLLRNSRRARHLPARPWFRRHSRRLLARRWRGPNERLTMVAGS